MASAEENNGYHMSRITGNVLLGNRLAGIKMELGAGSALIDNNIVAHNLFVGYGAFFSLNKYQDTFTWEAVWAKLREADLKPGEAASDAQGRRRIPASEVGCLARRHRLGSKQRYGRRARRVAPLVRPAPPDAVAHARPKEA